LITSEAPSALSRSAFSAVEVVAITRAPKKPNAGSYPEVVVITGIILWLPDTFGFWSMFGRLNLVKRVTNH
jgi:hypothetical protein